MNAAAEVEKIGVTKKLPGEIFVKPSRIHLQGCLHFVRYAGELLKQIFRCIARELAAHLAKMDSQKQERSELSSELFRSGHPNWGPGMRQDGSSGLTGDHRTHDVADRERRRTFRFRFALRCKSVRSFAGLADANGQRLSIQDRISIAEFAALVHLDRQAGQLFDHEFPSESGVPTGATSDDAHLLEVAELVFGDFHLAEIDVAGLL